MTTYPSSFEVLRGFQNHVIRTFRPKVYHFTTVVLFFEDIFVYCTHCFSVTLSLRMSACLSAHVGFRVAGKIGMSAGALPD